MTFVPCNHLAPWQLPFLGGGEGSYVGKTAMRVGENVERTGQVTARELGDPIGRGTNACLRTLSHKMGQG